MRIAAQLYTVRDLLGKASDMPRVLRSIRRIGYEAVELAGVEPSAGELIDAGLVACAAHVSLDDIKADPARMSRRCAEWGCNYLVIPSLPAEYRSEAGYARFAEVAVELARHGLNLAYHNHDFELAVFDGRTGLEILYSATPAGALKAELDTYWLEYAGADAAAWITRLAGRVPLVHLKDMAVRGGMRVQTEVGEGDLPWPAILGACRSAGVEWLIVEQDECEGDPLQSLALSYANLTELLA